MATDSENSRNCYSSINDNIPKHRNNIFLGGEGKGAVNKLCSGGMIKIPRSPVSLTRELLVSKVIQIFTAKFVLHPNTKEGSYSAVNEWQNWKLIYFTLLRLTPSFPIYLDKKIHK